MAAGVSWPISIYLLLRSTLALLLNAELETGVLRLFIFLHLGNYLNCKLNNNNNKKVWSLEWNENLSIIPSSQQFASCFQHLEKEMESML